MDTHESRAADRGPGTMERGTSQRLAARQRMWVHSWTGLCVLATLWSLAWVVGWISGVEDSWAFAAAGLVLLGCASWARRSAIRNAPPRHL
ncbi:hypothetical protein K377_04392 [Streptomyces sp. PsTaAH-137]|nr:hypothetical protein [Streptomyces sp. SID8367]RAJ82671.1 hypothetical protein K377_04392 [Streptomyces sp. PsTaAH-137]